jgi:mono/diheme cytochrome c family protein
MTMKRIVLASALAFLSIIAAKAQTPAALPPGEGRELLTVACTQCHGLSTILAMRNAASGWKLPVYAMVMKGAQLTPSEADTLIQYLTVNFGPGTPPAGGAPVTPATLPEGSGKDLVASRCTACHDLTRIVGAKRPKSEWSAVVANMITRGAAVSPDESQSIISYLVAQFGD